MLLKLLEEALDGQEASAKRGAELKTMKGKDLLSHLTARKADKAGKVVPVPAARVSGEGTPTKPKALVGKEKQQGTNGAAPSPKKKRARKVAEKAARGRHQEDGEEDEEEYGRDRVLLKKPKKKAAKNGLKVAARAWNGEELPRIAKVVKCHGEGPDFRLDVYAKKAGRGHWVETLYSLAAADLARVDHIPQVNKDIVSKSCQKALIRLYGQKWPSELRSALAATEWGKTILPSVAGAVEGLVGDFAELNDLHFGGAAQ